MQLSEHLVNLVLSIFPHCLIPVDVRLDLLQPGRVPGQLRRDRAQPQGGQEPPGGAQPVHNGLQCKRLVRLGTYRVPTKNRFSGI